MKEKLHFNKIELKVLSSQIVCFCKWNAIQIPIYQITVQNKQIKLFPSLLKAFRKSFYTVVHSDIQNKQMEKKYAQKYQPIFKFNLNYVTVSHIP